MIDFEKAKELMKKAVDESTVSQEIMERFIEAVYSCGYEDGMISIQPEQRWISVKERMPEERDSIFKERYGTDRWRDTMFLKTSDNVLATVVDDNGNYTVVPACTIDGRWSIWKNLYRKVVAWQQYPEPYQEEQDE